MPTRRKLGSKPIIWIGTSTSWLVSTATGWGEVVAGH